MPSGRKLVFLGGFSLAYSLLAELGHSLSFPGIFAVFWPPAGLYLVMLLANRRGDWPWLVLAVAAANLLSDMALHGKTWPVGMSFAAANTVEALAGAALFQCVVRGRLQEAPFGKVVWGLVAASAVASIAGALLGAATSVALLGAPSFVGACSTWWIADCLGCLIVAPALAVVARVCPSPAFLRPREIKGLLSAIPLARAAEAVVVFGGLACSVEFVYGFQSHPMSFAILPWLLWAALRFDIPGSAAASLIFALLSLWNTTHGRGPFAVIVEDNGRILLSGIALSVTAVSFLAVAVVVHERKRYLAELEETTEKFHAFMDNSPALAFMKDAEGRMVYINRATMQRFGAGKEGWLGKSDRELWPAELARELREHDLTVLAGDAVVHFIEGVPTADGQTHYYQSYKFPFTDSRGERFLAGMALDVTEEKRVLEALRASEQKFRRTIEGLAEGVFLLNCASGGIVEANEAFLQLLGYSLDAMLSLTVYDLVIGEERSKLEHTIAAVRERLAKVGRCNLGLQHLRRQDESIVDVEVSLGFVSHDLVSVIVRDVTERRRQERQLETYRRMLEESNVRLQELATTDALTGLKNRRAFREKLEEEFGRAARHAAPLSLLLLDVDHFKQFNDRFGHPAGDDVLRKVSAILLDNARRSDVVARYGGEEIAILLPNTTADGALTMAERFRQAIAEASWEKRGITVSIGCATLGLEHDNAATLIEEADEALYLSKASGRNRVQHASYAVAAGVN